MHIETIRQMTFICHSIFFSGYHHSPGIAEQYCLIAKPTTMDQLDRIEQKLDRLLSIMGESGSVKLTSEIRREAQAKVLQLSRKRRMKVGHVSADKK